MHKKRIVLIAGGILVLLAAAFPHYVYDPAGLPPENTANQEVLAKLWADTQNVDRIPPWGARPWVERVDAWRTGFEVFGLAFLTLALWMAAPGGRGER